MNLREQNVQLTHLGFVVLGGDAFLMARARHPVVQVTHHLDLQVLHHLHLRLFTLAKLRHRSR